MILVVRNCSPWLILSTILFLLLMGCTLNQPEKGALVQAGYADLSHWSLEESPQILLDGSWEFFWNRTPSDIPAQRNGDIVPIPGIWTQYPNAYQREGFGVLRASLLLPDTEETLGISMPPIGDSYQLFVDGRLLMEGGQPGITQETSIPGFHPRTALFSPDSKQIEIMIYVSNYAHIDPGIWYSITLGKSQHLIDRQQRSLYLEMFLFGALILMGFYHIGLFFFLRKGASPLYFGLLTIILALRVSVYGQYFLLDFFEDFPWEILQKIGMYTFYAGPILMYHFLLELFPKETNRWVVLSLDIVAGLMTLFALFTNYLIYSHLTVVYQGITLVGGSYMLYVLIRALIKKRTGAILFLAGFCVLFIALVNDILHTNLVIKTFMMIPMGMLAFVISQALVMTQKFSLAYRDVEQLTGRLAKINTSLTRFIPGEFMRLFEGIDLSKVQLGDHIAQNMAIMFMDIRNFTLLSEEMTPEENFRFINSFLKRMGPLVRVHGGFVDKYLGDGIMALFPGGAQDAMDSTLSMQGELVEYNRDRKRAGYRPLKIGFGLHWGELMVGTIGENQRMDFSVVSDAVNITSRIEGLNKVYGSTALVTESFMASLNDPSSTDLRFMGQIPVKGKTQPVSIFEVFQGEEMAIRRGKTASRGHFEKGVHFFSQDNLARAREHFLLAKTQYAEDIAVDVFLERIDRYEQLGDLGELDYPEENGYLQT